MYTPQPQPQPQPHILSSPSSVTPTYATDSIIGDYNVLVSGSNTQQLKKYLEPYSKDELLSLLMSLATANDTFCVSLLQKIKTDKKWCKLFVHGLAFSTKKETLESHYKQWGMVKEAVVLVDKKGSSKGYGFVTFDCSGSALEAAKDPKKKIDGRMTHCNLAFKGNPKKFSMGSSNPATALSPKQRENANDRRLFVHSLAWKTTDESLADTFREYGELQEAVVIRDKKTGKSKGYGFVTFKHSEDATSALSEPNKKIDGRQTHCNYACERSNINESINSPNSSHSHSHSHSHLHHQHQHHHQSPHPHPHSHHNIHSQHSHSHSMSSLTSPSMALTNNANQTIPNFTSSPLALNASLSVGSTTINPPQQLPTVITSMTTAPSPQRRPVMPSTYAPTSSAYGANTVSPNYGNPMSTAPAPSSHSTHPGHPRHNEPLSLLRSQFPHQPNSPIPTLPIGLSANNMSLSGLVMPANHPRSSTPGYPHNGHPSSNPNGGHLQIGMSTQNLFPSMNPQPPATPPYTHIKTSKDSPYFNGSSNGPLSIPKFSANQGLPQLDGMASLTNPTQKKIIATNPQPMIPLNIPNLNHVMAANQPGLKIGAGKQIKVAPLKMNINGGHIQHVDDGNMSPKSQPGSDDEGDDKK